MPLPTTTNYTGSTRGVGYHARLGTTYLRLVASPERQAQTETADLQAQRVDTSSNPEDFSNEYGLRYSIVDFSGGEGLRYAHRRNTPIQNRYYDSRNINVDSKGRVELLETTEEVESSANTGLYGDWDGTTLRWTDGTTLRATTDPEATTPTISNEDPHAAEGASTITGIVHVGTTLYAGVADGLHTYTVAAGSWSHLVTEANGMGRVWAAKGRCIYAAQDANSNWVLRELTDPSIPTTTDLITLPPGATFLDVADAQSHVLVSTSEGQVYAFTFDGSAFTLSGQTPFIDEVPCALGHALGVVYFTTYATTRAGGKIGRLYRATIPDADGVLRDWQLLRKWGDDATTLDRTPYWLSVGRDSVFMAVREGASEVDLWRYDTTYGAMHRSYIVGEGGNSRSFVIVDGVPWMWVDAGGTYRVTDTLASSGYVISPLADHYTKDNKAWAGLEIKHSTLPGDGSSIAVAYTTEPDDIDDASSSTWTAGFTKSLGAPSPETRLTDVESAFFATKTTLTNGTTDPKLDVVAVRSYPVDGDTLIDLPVNVSDQVSRPGRRRTNIKGHGNRVVEALRSIEGSSLELELYDFGERYIGSVAKVNRPVLQFTDRGTPSLVASIRFRGRLIFNNYGSYGEGY